MHVLSPLRQAIGKLGHASHSHAGAKILALDIGGADAGRPIHFAASPRNGWETTALIQPQLVLFPYPQSAIHSGQAKSGTVVH